MGRFGSSKVPNASFDVHMTSWKKCSIFGAFRIKDCEPVLCMYLLKYFHLKNSEITVRLLLELVFAACLRSFSSTHVSASVL